MIITDSVISRLNEDITKLGESKLQAMQESKEYRSGSLHLRLGSGDCSDSFLVFNPFPTGGGAYGSSNLPKRLAFHVALLFIANEISQLQVRSLNFNMLYILNLQILSFLFAPTLINFCQYLFKRIKSLPHTLYCFATQ